MTSFVVVKAAFFTRLSSNSSLVSNASFSVELVDCFVLDEDDTVGFCKLLPKIIAINNILSIKILIYLTLFVVVDNPASLRHLSMYFEL
jgi:hypothetical protein